MNKIRDLILEIYPRLFARKCFWKFNQMLVDIGYRGLGILNWKNYALSGESFLSKYLKKNYCLDIIFDVGANVGNYSKNFIDTEAKFYCFEPDPITFGKLKENIGISDKVICIQKGLSDIEGESKIYDYESVDSSSHASMYKEVITDINNSNSKEQTIELTTIDSYVSEKKIEKINFLKIDTEGNELKVLKGSQRTLADKKIDIIQFEFNEMNVISRCYLRDFLILLSEYNLYRLLPKGLLPVKYMHPHRYEIFGFQNIVAIRKDIDKNQTIK